MSSDGSSRISGFRRHSVDRRREILRERLGLDEAAFQALDAGGIDVATADTMIENVVGKFALPFGVALNFVVNDRQYFVPMVVEEPSVVAAASNAARMVREGGGFRAECDRSLMIGQIQLKNVTDTEVASSRIAEAKDAILRVAAASECAAGLSARGGGPRDLTVRVLARSDEPGGGMIAVHLEVDVVDAMGANLVNGLCEALAERVAVIAGCGAKVGLRILSNLADRRCARVTARVPSQALGGDDLDGAEVRDLIADASRFAELDPYRAATHNKGIMNGIDAVLVATGNDWRGVEAGAHAFAARSGRYSPLAVWRADGDDLVGTMELPMAVAAVAGAQRVHAGTKLAFALLRVGSAAELAQVAAAAGLASNLAALRALATEGIQRGHMSLHARVVARAAGASSEEIDRVAEEISALKDVRLEAARTALERLRAPRRVSETRAAEALVAE